MNNSDERDYAEEMANQNVLHTGDGEVICGYPYEECNGHETDEEYEARKQAEFDTTQDMPRECEHYWQPGDIRSDFICANCGERSDMT